MVRLLLMLALAAICSACATYGQDRHFENTPEAERVAREPVSYPDRATVYFFRERAWLQAALYTPIPPAYFAVDDRLVSVMPVGSFVVLALPPGPHKFTRLVVGGDWLFPLQINRHDAVVTLEPGKVYYVGSVNTFGPDPVRALDESTGAKAVAEARLARLIYNPLSVDEFVSRLRAADARGKSSPATRTGSSWQASTSSAALPSQQQVTSFLETLAVLALTVFAVKGVAGAAPQQPLPPPAYRPPVAISQPAPSSTAPVALDQLQSWRTSTGTLSEILRSRERVEVRDINSGVRYTIEDGRVTGSDGSRLRVYGTEVVSDNGFTFQVIGNNVYTRDGRVCTRIGSQLSCR